MRSVDPKLRLLVRHSAAAQDVALAGELLRHLEVVERFAGVDIWTDARIPPGDDTRREIQRAIDRADVAILLLSADFFASNLLLDVEVPQLLERHRAGKLRVIPIVLRSCLWQMHPWLKELHPLPRGRKAIGSFAGEERDAALTEVVREIVGMAEPSTRTPSHVSAPTKTGGDTYNIQIHGSTIGAFGAGTGVDISGLVVEQRSAPAAATGRDGAESLPLVVLGPRIVAEGRRIAAAGNRWTLQLSRFLVGGTSALCEFSEAIESLPLHERCIVLSDPCEGRVLTGMLSWRANGELIEVEATVAPSQPKTPVTEVEDLDSQWNEVRGIAAGALAVERCLLSPIGVKVVHPGCCSRIGEWMQTVDLRPHLDNIIRVEITRLATIPLLDTWAGQSREYAPLSFIDRVQSVRARLDATDDGIVPAQVELLFVRGGIWKGEIRVIIQQPDFEAEEARRREMLAQALRP